MNKPNVFDYTDYRQFLSDQYLYSKKIKPVLSYNYCARKIKTSASYLKHIISKKRHLSLNKLILLCELFEIRSLERDYFITLVLKDITKEKDIKDYYSTLLHGFKKQPQKPTQSDKKQDLIFKDWLTMALDSLVRLKDFKNDINWIHQKLGGEPIKKGDIKTALEEMKLKGSLIEEDGKLKQPGFVYREAKQGKFNTFAVYEVGQRRAIQSLKEMEKFGHCHYHMMSLALNKEEANRVITLMQELRNNIIEISKQSVEPSRVYFMSNNFFLISNPE